MPEDSGWYWCTSEGFQSGVYLQVLRNIRDSEDNAYSTFSLRSTSTPTPMQVTPGRGNADRLSVYKTYGSGWSEYQVRFYSSFGANHAFTLKVNVNLTKSFQVDFEAMLLGDEKIPEVNGFIVF